MLTEMLATRDSLPTTRYCAIVLHFAALKPARWGHRAPPLSAKFRLGRNDSMERLGRALRREWVGALGIQLQEVARERVIAQDAVLDQRVDLRVDFRPGTQLRVERRNLRHQVRLVEHAYIIRDIGGEARREGSIPGPRRGERIEIEIFRAGIHGGVYATSDVGVTLLTATRAGGAYAFLGVRPVT